MVWPISPNVTQTKLTGTTATSGDNTLIAAPGSGKQIVISQLILQNESATATTLVVKAGATAILRVLCQNQGDGLSQVYPPERCLAIGDNTALVLNLSGANSCGYTVLYYVDAV
jgi:hypothetical protein